MEDGLVQMFVPRDETINGGLNPYCDGRCSRTKNYYYEKSRFQS